MVRADSGDCWTQVSPLSLILLGNRSLCSIKPTSATSMQCSLLGHWLVSILHSKRCLLHLSRLFNFEELVFINHCQIHIFLDRIRTSVLCLLSARVYSRRALYYVCLIPQFPEAMVDTVMKLDQALAMWSSINGVWTRRWVLRYRRGAEFYSESCPTEQKPTPFLCILRQGEKVFLAPAAVLHAFSSLSSPTQNFMSACF